MQRTHLFIIFAALLSLVSGCFAPNIRLFTDSTEPLREFTLEGEDKGKVLLVSVSGIISDAPGKGVLRSRPSMVQGIVSQLRKAEKDDEIKAVLLKIDSPGGTVTASDLLYHEIMAFKERTGAKVIAAMMDVVASGGYYIALPADVIMAHPTTVTGSVGVVFMRPKAEELMQKIGLGVEVCKSGKNKDMASPFRDTTQEEQKILQSLVDELAERFLSLVSTHRDLNPDSLAKISNARIYLGKEAQKMGLIDDIGYLSDAISKAKSEAGLPEDAKVVVYRRTEYPDDNSYNTAVRYGGGSRFSLIDLGLPDTMRTLNTGFYYLWLPASGN